MTMTLEGNKLRAFFGFGLLAAVLILAMTIALGDVKQESSHGLDLILGCFTTLTGSFATWAFGQSKSSDDKQVPPAAENK